MNQNDVSLRRCICSADVNLKGVLKDVQKKRKIIKKYIKIVYIIKGNSNWIFEIL